MAAALMNGEGLDVVIDTAARSSTLEAALAMIRKQGRVVLVGVPTEPLTLDLAPILYRELHVLGSLCYGIAEGKREFDEALGMVMDRRIDVGSLVTHTVPLEDAGEAFRIAADKSTGSIKVVVRATE